MRQSETLCASSRQGEESGHPAPGDQPQNWRATAPRNGGLQPENFTGHRYFLTLSGGYMSEVAHGSGTMVQCLVITFLSFSSALSFALVLCPTLPEVCLMEDRLLHLSVLSLRHGRC